MRTRFIYNPRSGHNLRNPGLLWELRRRCQVRCGEAELVETQGPGHATQIAQAAVLEGVTQVVAVGGDGTMNEVAQGLMGSSVPLGLVPCGSGNGLALHLGIPINPLDAADLLLSHRTRTLLMDTGRADGHPFFNAMGLGLDAEISRSFNRLTRRGFHAYIRTTLRALLSHRPQNYSIVNGSGKPHSFRAMIIAVGNSDQYGNNARIAPGARVDDGQLDLMALRPVGLLGAIDITTRLFNGSLKQSAHALSLRGNHFNIHRTLPGPLHTDGETHDAGLCIEVRIVEKSLRILVPDNSHVFN